MAPHTETAPGPVRQLNGCEGQDVDVAVRLLALVPGVVDGQRKCLPFDIGPALLVLPPTEAEPGRLQPELTTVFLDHQVHIGVPIDLSGLDRMADLCGNCAEQFVHRLGNREPFGKEPGHPIPMQPHLEMPDHGGRDPPLIDFAWGQSGRQPGTGVQDPNFNRMFSSQVPIHISDGVASFGRSAQVPFDVAADGVRGSGCGDPVVLHMPYKGIHDLILAFMGARGKGPS